MKKVFFSGLALFLLLSQPFLISAEDVQQDLKSTLIEKAKRKASEDESKARREAIKREAEILFESGELEKRLSEIEQASKKKQKMLSSLNKRYMENDKEIERLQKKIEDQEGAMNEISGSVRGIAQDTAVSLRNSIVSGEIPNRNDLIEPLLSEIEFPSLENITKMVEVIFGEIQQNGRISTKPLKYIGADGRETEGLVMRIGAFNALYYKDGKAGYLEYIPVKQAFHQLTVEPPKEMIKEATRFFEEKSSSFYLDLSSGSAFRQLTDMPTWYEGLKAGGVLIYPLIFIGAIALILIFERMIVLVKEGGEAERLSTEINPMLKNREWNKAVERCQKRKSSLSKVVEEGITHRSERVEVLESVMQEAIQGTLPRLERNMSALQILGMVAPLIGLLGTVTGMISTFQMITLYGTGDPKIMSGGISEALVTTEYGLIVAIPIILMHGYLNSRIDRIVGILEERAITIVNSVKKSG